MKICLALTTLFCGSAFAQGFEPNFWGGIGGGAYTAKDYPPDAGSQDDPDHNKVGGYSIHGTLNFTGSMATFRIRQSALFGFTSNRADETALEAGLPLGWNKTLWAAAGVSRLTDVSNTRKAPTVGFPLELDYYPVRGLELMVHANFNKDDNYVGFGISGAIGRQRAQ
jgi:hypothetical protein